MTDATLISYEELRDRLAELSVPAGEARRLIWIVPGRVGAALTASGGHEIFLGGPELSASIPLVARHLQHDRWEPNNGEPTFAATRVLLGSATHFAAMAALIAVELARFDLSTEDMLQAAFERTEPLIELAIRRGTLSTEALLGLFAELQLLRIGLLAVPAEGREAVLLGWRGWTTGRDFVFGRHVIEVKATLGPGSRHSFSGVHQLEAQSLTDGGTETLHLMSFGLVEAGVGGQSLPDLVEDLAALLDGDDLHRGPGRARFIQMVRQYGGTNVTGYDHETMRDWAAYQGRYGISFARLYSVDDPAMRLLTSSLIDQTFAVPSSVTFELQLPNQVSAFNPATNWQAEVAAMATWTGQQGPEPTPPV